MSSIDLRIADFKSVSFEEIHCASTGTYWRDVKFSRRAPDEPFTLLLFAEDRDALIFRDPLDERTSPSSGYDAIDALRDLVAIIDAAGLSSLANCVQLGPVVWFVKATERMDWARKIIADYDAIHGAPDAEVAA